MKADVPFDGWIKKKKKANAKMPQEESRTENGNVIMVKIMCTLRNDCF